jgi:pyruvate formate lyase activating enzyme
MQDLSEALAHIEKRKSVLGGVVLSGGEPTLFRGLPDLIRRIKLLGLKVKLDTNGTKPDVLEQLLADKETRPDFIAMDLKLAPDRYVELLPKNTAEQNVSGDPMRDDSIGNAIKRSAYLLHKAVETQGKGALLVEFRSLALPIFTEHDRTALAELAGTLPWVTRPFVPGNCLDPAWNGILDTA